MEIQLGALRAAGLFQLGGQGFLADADPHAGDLEGAAQDIVPHQNIAVESPIVIVGGAAVVRLAALQLVADAHDKDRSLFLADGVLPLLGSEIGPAVLQLLGGDEEDLLRQGEIHTGKFIAGRPRRLLDGIVDVPHGLHQVFGGALLLGDDLFPVPLVHIDRVEVVQILVPADGVHVGIEASPGLEAIGPQGPALPFGQRLHHLDVLAHGENIKLHRALHAVEVVVEAALQGDEQGGGDPLQVERHGEIPLEIVLDHLDPFLRVANIQPGMIALRQDESFLCHAVQLL